MKIAVIIGTRPEMIKMWSIIRLLQERGINYLLIHTGQHYSANMKDVFFHSLHLPKPHYNLNVGSDTQGRQIALMLRRIGEMLAKEKPELVMIQGDTNTVLAGALAASKLALKLDIKVAHVEAGLRSFDCTMPEETGRIIADHASDYLFAPTNIQKQNLLYEGVSPEKIYVVGNSIADAVKEHLHLIQGGEYLHKHSLQKQNYFLVTMHRVENTDNCDKLKQLLDSLGKVYEQYKLPLFYPVHPRMKKRIKEFNLPLPPGLTLTDPLDYLEFLQLLHNAKAVLTDSGGVQEEASILRVPCITLRNNTERPETVQIGANIVAGTKPLSILQAIELMLSRKREWNHPFGEGDTGKKIMDVIQKDFAKVKMLATTTPRRPVETT